MKKIMLSCGDFDRINILKFILIIGVIYIHNTGNAVQYSDNTPINSTTPQPYFVFIQSFISEGLARIAVPLFYLISGYLFFVNFNPTAKNFLKKLTNRFQSLALPYLFWNFATMAIMIAAQNIPATSVFFRGGGYSFFDYSFQDYIEAFFGINRMPISYQFWFIRDLMLVMTASPIIYLLSKHFWLLYNAVLFAFWMLDLWSVSPSIIAVLFFSIGASMALNGINIMQACPMPRTFSAILIISAITSSTMAIHGYKIHNSMVQKLTIIIGIFTAMSVVKSIDANTEISKKLISFGNYSFFIFATHEPLLGITRKILFKFIPSHSSLLLSTVYLLLPIALTATLISFGKLIHSRIPAVYRIITGGRS